jgi:hypothetical protein
MDQHHVRFTTAAKGKRLAGPDGDGFYGISGLFLEHGNQDVEQA